MRRIELADFLIIAEFHTGIDAHRLSRMTRVVQLADAALAAPFAGFGEVDLFRSCTRRRLSTRRASSDTTRFQMATSGPPTTS
jgi:hypothetical protein